MTDRRRALALRKKAMSGVAMSATELGELRGLLASKDEDALTDAIYALGYIGDEASKPRILRILETTSDCLVAYEAIWVLARHFDDPQLTRPTVVEVLSGEGTRLEDLTGDLTLVAAKIAGDLIVLLPDDLELIGHLLAVYENASIGDVVRDQAYRSLARLVGDDYETLEYAAREVPAHLVNKDLIARLKLRVSRLN